MTAEAGADGGIRDASPRSKRNTLALVVLFVLPSAGACGGDAPMPGMGTGAFELPAGVAADSLPDPDSRGARLTADYCSQCHGIPSPRRHGAEDWEATARRMFRRMDHMEHMGRGMMGRSMHRGMMDVSAPTREERTAILDYLRSHSLASVGEESLPPGEGREAFRTVCSRCHALPDPAQHARDEWPAVVERMRTHMAAMEVSEPSAEETAAIVRYLRGAASRSK